MHPSSRSQPVRWWVPLAAIVAAWALVFIVSCANKPTVSSSAPPPAPPPPGYKHYVLSSLSYEDVVPGQYAAHLKNFTGGPAAIDFAEGGKGKLSATSNVSGTMEIVFPDGTVQTQAVSILPQGYGDFVYALDTAGTVTFLDGPHMWPLQSGAKLSNLEYSFSDKHCYDEGCTNYELLAFTWKRAQ